MSRKSSSLLLSANSEQMAVAPSLILLHCVFEETIVSAKSINLSHKGICQPVKLIIYLGDCGPQLGEPYFTASLLNAGRCHRPDYKKELHESTGLGHSQSAKSVLRHSQCRHLINLTPNATLNQDQDFFGCFSFSFFSVEKLDTNLVFFKVRSSELQ